MPRSSAKKTSCWIELIFPGKLHPKHHQLSAAADKNPRKLGHFHFPLYFIAAPVVVVGPEDIIQPVSTFCIN